ncbi:MAG: hypothetical protein LBI59_02930 [Candidatus Accumulibacter sp.]|nr:hypothetical protein [Accumulibacter sp.]
MKFVSRDLSGLRGSLLAFLLMLVFGGIVVAFSRADLASARTAFSVARAERNEIDGRLRRLRGEEQVSRQKVELFRQLEARGVVGEEQRLEWVELLGEIRDRFHMIEVRYEFSPRRVLDDVARAGGFGLYASAMKLNARLLHEEDLIRLLDALHRQARALIRVRHCEVKRLSGVGEVMRGLLESECLIDWITLGDGGAGDAN